MGNTIINWRFGCYHFQILKDRPFVRLSFNPCHVGRKQPWFERY